MIYQKTPKPERSGLTEERLIADFRINNLRSVALPYLLSAAKYDPGITTTPTARLTMSGESGAHVNRIQSTALNSDSSPRFEQSSQAEMATAQDAASSLADARLAVISAIQDLR